MHPRPVNSAVGVVRLALSALLFSLAAAQFAVFSESAAQLVTLDYAENDPRLNTVEPCETLRGTVQIADSGDSVCTGIDKNDTFCIVGSDDAFPCEGFYKHVVVCNKEHNRIALNPFFLRQNMPGRQGRRGHRQILRQQHCRKMREAGY